MSDLKIPNKGKDVDDVNESPFPVSWYSLENSPIAFFLLLFRLKMIPNFFLFFSLKF